MIRLGLLIAAGSALPLFVTGYLHPDANPIGFGLLVLFGAPTGLALAAIGAVRRASGAARAHRGGWDRSL